MIYRLYFFLFLLLFSNISFSQNSISSKNIDEIKFVKEEIFDKVDQTAEFPGGQRAMGKFILKNLIYPKEVLKMNVSGKTIVKFIVGSNGKISDIKVLQSLSEILDKEIIRVIKLMPDWIPAQISGKYVNSIFILPLNICPFE